MLQICNIVGLRYKNHKISFFMIFLVAPTKTRRIRNFTVQEAVNYVLEPNSDSELSDLEESNESGNEAELGIDHVVFSSEESE